MLSFWSWLLLPVIFLVLAAPICYLSGPSYLCLFPFWSWLLLHVIFLVLTTPACYLSGPSCSYLLLSAIFLVLATYACSLSGSGCFCLILFWPHFYLCLLLFWSWLLLRAIFLILATSFWLFIFPQVAFPACLCLVHAVPSYFLYCLALPLYICYIFWSWLPILSTQIPPVKNLATPSCQLSCLCFFSISYLFQSTLSSILSCLATALYNLSLLLPPVNCLVLACPHQLPSVSRPSSSFLLLSFPCMTTSARYLSKTGCPLLVLSWLPPPVTLPRCYFLLWGCTFPVPAASGDYLYCLVCSLQLPNWLPLLLPFLSNLLSREPV